MIMVGDWAPANRSATIVHTADLWLGNLEGPILTTGHGCAPVKKAGPHVHSLAKPTGAWVLCGANNHMMDYGWEGVQSASQALDAQGAVLVGVGEDVMRARQARVVSTDGVAVAIIACCEVQFGIAGAAHPGCAAVGPWVTNAIRSMKARVDHVIVSCHAGLEDYAIPAPGWVELYRSWIDAGASIVHGHHAHVPQAFEEYRGGLIAYGLGNFAVDPAAWRLVEHALWSLAIDVTFERCGFTWTPLIFEIRETGPNAIEVSRCEGDAARGRLAHLERCNRILQDAALLESVWQEVALHAFETYGADFTDWRRLTPRRAPPLNALYDRMRRALKQKESIHAAQLLRYVMVSCESQRQMLATALGVLSGELPDRRSAASAAAFRELAGGST